MGLVPDDGPSADINKTFESCKDCYLSQRSVAGLCFCWILAFCHAHSLPQPAPSPPPPLPYLIQIIHSLIQPVVLLQCSNLSLLPSLQPPPLFFFPSPPPHIHLL